MSITSNCPVCKSNASFWVKLPAVSLYRCAACDHCFTEMSSMLREEAYGSESYEETHKNWFENPNRPLFSLLRAEIESRNTGSLLDVGCGNGAFLHHIQDSIGLRDLYGIDLSSAASDSTSIKFIQANFLTYKFHRQFDAIVTLAVIEHLDDVTSFVARIHELLNVYGTAYVMALNEGGLLYQLANILRQCGLPSVFIRLYDPHHVNHFSKSSLLKLLSDSGQFQLEKIIDHNAPLAAIDIPSRSTLTRVVMKMGVAAVFFFGKAFKRAYLQTVIVSRVK